MVPLLLAPPGDFARAFFDPPNLLSLLLRNALLIAVFYTNYLYLTPVVLQRKGVMIYILIVLVIIAIVSIVNWKIHNALAERMPPPAPGEESKLPPHHGPGNRFRPVMFASPLFSSLLITGLVVIFSTSLFLWEDWNKTKELAREQELQKKNAELAALKLQISPHFLFNTLNNIRWLVRSKSDQAEDSVVKLSQLLRHILYETGSDRVELSKEIEHLNGYIELQKMRLTDSQSFAFTRSGHDENKMIVPLLLLPIAENLFKHGDFTAGHTNTLKLKIEDHRLIVDTENRILISPENTERETSGIGLANLEKRLVMHYFGNSLVF
ncbi:MAG: sensor histidine kinase [Flammeovirgaceae bacterium]